MPDQPPPDPAELLLASAPLARRWAARQCVADPFGGGTCGWYHGVWQYLRILDVVAAPREHAQFFADTLGGLARAGGFDRVLVSGAADYSMLAQVIAAYHAAGQDPAVTVVDRCPTPVLLCRWYARRIGIRIDSAASNILAFHAPAPFDVICTHSFLGYFPPAMRERLVAHWGRLLRLGGKVVTIHRIRAGHDVKVIGFTADQIAAFHDRTLAEAAKWSSRLGIEPAELAGWARTYAERFRVHAIASVDDIAGLFARHGFRLDEAASSPVSEGAVRRPSGPSAPGGADYHRIVATRL